MNTIFRVPGNNTEIAQTVITAMVGSPGPQGAQGPVGPAGATSVTMTASGAIGGHRAVVPNGSGGVVYADAANPSHRGLVIGITIGAAVDSAPVSVMTGGEMTESSWAWAPGEIYLGTNGTLTQTPPSSGFVQVMGTSTEPTKMIVGIQTPILLI